MQNGQVAQVTVANFFSEIFRIWAAFNQLHGRQDGGTTNAVIRLVNTTPRASL